jgi:DNA-binding NarL/FixJ family response regulator
MAGQAGRPDPVTWPVVGRTEELALIDDLLGPHERAGVVIAGAAGVGKTRLLDEALQHAAGRGLRTMRAVATRAARAIPFGALSHLLPDTLSSEIGLRNLIGVAAHAIASPDEPDQTLLAVDDAQNLDEHSAALLHQLALTRRARIAVTVRTGEPMPDAVTSLWKDQLCERIELQPLSSAEVGELLELALAGAVDEAAVQRLAVASEGNPLYLRELVLGALETGALAHTGDVWRWKGALTLTARLTELIESRLAALGRPEREALEIVATADVLEARVFEDMVGSDVVGSLERSGLLQAWTDQRRAFVRLGHPLYGEAIRAKAPEARLRTIRTALADAIAAAGSRRRGDLLRVATWRLDAGGASDPQMLLAAAQRAIAMLDPHLAERLARGAIQSGGGFIAEMLTAQAIWMQGRPDVAEQELARIEREVAPDEMSRAMARGSRTQILFWVLQRHEEAIDLLIDLEQSATLPEVRTEAAANRAYFLYYFNRGREGRALAEELMAGPPLPPRTLVLVMAPLVWSLMDEGRFTEALGLLESRSDEVMEGVRHMPWAPITMAGPRLFVAAARGDLDAIDAEMEALNTMALESGADWLRGYALCGLGWSSLLRGRLRTAEAQLRQALPLIDELQVGGGMEMACGLLAQTLGALGDAAGAEEAIARVTAPPAVIMAILLDEGRIWAAAASGAPSKAIEIALGTAGRANSADSAMTTLWVLHDAARLGAAAQVVDDARAVAQRVEGPRAAATALHITSLARSDAAGLDAAAAAFAELGLLLYAAEAAAEAARIHAKNGLRASAQASREQAAAFAARCEGARTPALLELSDSPLSTREREIATLAARGLSNAEIADRLVLSVRTIENHLRAVYAKLGVEGRRELAAIIDAG